MSFLDISKHNLALNFIDARIRDNGYRGAHHSQHNRYVFEQIYSILDLLNKYAPESGLLKIRTTDISKRPKNTPDEYQYASFCEEAKNLCGIGTQDAMRKNIFVDLHRMGLINRYNQQKQLIPPFRQVPISYVSISKLGLDLINGENLENKYFLFTRAIDQLLNGVINTLLNLLRDDEYELNSVDIFEYMFFITAIDLDSSFSFRKTRDEVVELIKSYRLLTKYQKTALIESLKTELDPKKTNGNKLYKRDFHNWLNEAQQVYYLLNQTVYFENRLDKLLLRTGRDSVFEGEKRLNRSLSEKYEYFSNHRVSKKSGFELHHVVPLAWSNSVEHFKVLDKWKNMVYIDAFNHAKITQNNNKNVVMEFSNSDMKLSDYNGHEVTLRLVDNILYHIANKDLMLGYNKELRGIKS